MNANNDDRELRMTESLLKTRHVFVDTEAGFGVTVLMFRIQRELDVLEKAERAATNWYLV